MSFAKNNIQGLQRPKEFYYVLKRPIQNTYYTVVQEGAHSNRRALVAFRTMEQAQLFKRMYVNVELEKHTYKSAIAKNIQPKAMDMANLQGLCEIAALDCVCFSQDLEHSFLISPLYHQTTSDLRAHVAYQYTLKSYEKVV